MPREEFGPGQSVLYTNVESCQWWRMPKITYLNAAGEEVPSTTTIIGKYKDMGGLMHFAWSEGKAGRGLNESRDRAGDIGSMLHGMIEAYIRAINWGPPADSKSEDIDLAMRLFTTFKRWWAENKIEVVATEVSLVSEDYQYGGTLDLVARFPIVHPAASVGATFLGLMDWKTSSAYYQEMLLQMAAYRQLWYERNMSPGIVRATLVLFSKTDAKMKIYPVTSEDMDLAFKKFLLLRGAYDMEAAINKSVKETRRAAISYDYSAG